MLSKMNRYLIAVPVAWVIVTAYNFNLGMNLVQGLGFVAGLWFVYSLVMGRKKREKVVK